MRKVWSLLVTLVIVLELFPFAALPVAEAAVSTETITTYYHAGHRYRIYEMDLTWLEAKEYCERVGGHLATITSASEQAAVENMIKNCTSKEYLHIGMTDMDEEGNWKWITGEPFVYQNWGLHQPDNNLYNGDDQDFGAIKCGTSDRYNQLGDWDDAGWIRHSSGPQHYRGFLCEWGTSQTSYPTKSNSEYCIKVMDDVSGSPIKNAVVRFGTYKSFYTDSFGLAKISVTDVNNFTGDMFSISADHYVESFYNLSSLNLYAQNNARLRCVSAFGGSFLDLSTESLTSTTIEGPSVSLFGYEHPLFTMDVGLDFSKIPGLQRIEILNNANNIDIDTKTKTVRVMLGTGDGYRAKNGKEWTEDYQDFKSFCHRRRKGASDAEIWEEYRKIKPKTKKTNLKIGIEASVSLCGFVELNYSSGHLEMVDSGAVLIAEAAADHRSPFPIPIFYWNFGVKGDFTGGFRFVPDSDGSINKIFGIDATLTPHVGIGFQVGVDKRKVPAKWKKLVAAASINAEAGVEGTIRMKVSAPASSLQDALNLTANMAVYVRGHISLLEFEPNITPLWNFQLYPKKNRLLSASPVTEEAQWVPVSREYLNAPSIGTYTADGTLHEQNIYPYAAPQLVPLSDNRAMALWLKDDGSKTDHNRTTLYYSLYTDGEWSEPLPVCETAVADLAPVASVDGDTVHILWQRYAEAIGDSLDVDTALSNTELVYISFTDGVFSEPQIVDGSEEYQPSYSITAENGTVYAAWSEFSNEDTQTVYRVLLNDETLSPVPVMTDCYVTSVANGFENGEVYTACIAAETIDDAETLYVNGEAVNSALTVGGKLSYKNGKLYFLDGDSVCEYQDGTITDTSVGGGAGQFSVLSDGSLVFPVANEFKNELYISFPTEDGYTAPVQLTHYDMHVAGHDVDVIDGRLMTFACVEELDDSAEADSPYGATHLIAEEQSLETNIAVDPILCYDEQADGDNQTVLFETTVTNLGGVTVNSLTATLTDADGTELHTSRLATPLAPGASTAVSVAYVLPPDFSKQDFTLTVAADGETDLSDNKATTTIGHANLVMNELTCENGVIKGSVTNNGAAPAENVSVTFSHLQDTPVEIGVQECGTLQAGQTVSFEQPVSEDSLLADTYFKSDAFSVSAATSSVESSLGDNDQTGVIDPIRVTDLTLNTQKITMVVDTQSSLSATVQPAQAVDKNVVFLSDSTDVVTVDENGTLQAVGAGQAIITAISDDGGFTDACDVTVLMRGDVTQDGVLNTSDAKRILRYALKFDTLPDALHTDLSDFDGNGKVSTLDARKILNKVIG